MDTSVTSLENLTNIPQLPGPGICICTTDTSWDITVPGTREGYIWNAHIQMVPRMDFSGLPRRDWDGICWNPIPELLRRVMGRSDP
jgi:hypothetical protein